MEKNIVLPTWATEFLKINDASEIECVTQPNRTVIVRKKRVPQRVDPLVLSACRDYIYKHTCDLIRVGWILTTYFDRKKSRTVVQITDQQTKLSHTGHAKFNATSEIYDAEVGIAIALCRVLNGKHCDYQKIIGFKMA